VVTGTLPTVSLFLALLAVVAQVTTAGTVTLAGLGAVPGGIGRNAGRALRLVHRELAPHARLLAVGVATVATVGSLYFSEIAGFPPCRLCWYQRFAMYPLVVILTAAHLLRDRRAGTWFAGIGAALATVGLAVATWHVVLERFPSLQTQQSCDPANPCTIIWVERLGYQTIPVMSLSAFALILTLLALDRRISHGNP
jgi:disulfide bond formation protein DsbB